MSINDDKTQIVSVNSSKANISHFNNQDFIGKLLSNRYLIVELIGQGGMSYIYRARDTFLEHNSLSDYPIVIKILRPEFSQSPEAIRLLKEEAAQTQPLSHPNIIKVFTTSTEDNTHYIVMEWVNGETLEQLIKRNKPTGIKFKTAYPIIKQLISALDYAHSHGVIHNDLKPSNIIITGSGELKILDFGIAKQLTNNDAYAFSKKNDNEVIGGYTPSYASPEQLNGYSADVKDDFFSLGCIIYEVLSSRHPYERKASNTLNENTKAKKPKNSPFFYWRALKSAVSLKANKRQNILQRLSCQPFQGLTTIATSILIVLALLVAASYAYQNIHAANSQLIAEKNNAVAMNNQITQWMSWDAQRTLNYFNQIPPQFNTIKQGLLKIHQQEIIQIFDDRIANVKNIEGKIKNYPAISKIYQQALTYYPDSRVLHTQYNNMQVERQSISMDIITRINNMLNQQRYFEKDQNNILVLLHKLSIIGGENTFTPTKQQTKTFKAALKKAQASGNKTQTKTLMSIDKALFNKSDS
ncbi:Serine/threonine-protein kinase PrkC [Marinomonas spartinae]|uniref:serine/threonine-protein kinase n=1 Tax=Marinomonas spartinae TaxID=1792290 RepID=UPI000808EC2A|nr:serine/threonine-protein kinase [Marinomonas spartinae]SBS38277.1 Serine/threonine-protein kinase PrkC [Marinomonas spartinae]